MEFAQGLEPAKQLPNRRWKNPAPYLIIPRPGRFFKPVGPSVRKAGIYVKPVRAGDAYANVSSARRISAMTAASVRQ